ncbi:MAG TPA: protein-disulfide reductase DsbD [Noviherbaspirillum sp.]|nr:protein-disulfide reductase DsbD [Noviherbaspirillum sp.]
MNEWARIPVLFLLGLALLWPMSAKAEDFLEPEKAFRFSARMADPQTAEIVFRIADGYYMYRERFAFKADGARLGEAIIPEGKIKFDETFQKDVETHRGTLSIRVPVEAAGPFTLHVTSQGCSDKGLCYSPMDSKVRLSPTGGGGTLAALLGTSQPPLLQSVPGMSPAIAPQAEMGRIEASLASGQLMVIVPLFLLLGLGLAFTPCVLPMVPILSSIIIGEGRHVSRGRGLALAASYSLGMALVYTGLGVAAGLAGEGLAASLQTPLALGVFALLMVLLSLSMFGVYQLQVPAALQAKLMRVSDRQPAGKLAGVFGMGAISALIVGPCVAAPLAGALMYISQTRDVMIGGSALFAMAAGMSVPLLLVGVSAGALLPRAGAWMTAVRILFGVLMLALAVWILAPVVPAWFTMAGWAALAIGYGIFLLRGRFGWFSKLAALLLLGLGLVQVAGLATGGRDALAPLAHLGGSAHKTEFQRVRSVAELDAVLARADGRTVMLDFYADWCVSCIEMEKLTFSDPRIKAEFADMVLLQADVTANNEDDKALLRRFRLFGPPGIIFFDGQGREIPGGRVIGFQDARRFGETLELVKGF